MYQSFVTASTAPSVATFFTYLPTSIYYAWLSEYNTTSPAQTIGTGSYGGSFTITPRFKRSDRLGPPLAWYKIYGEKEWSNQKSACILNK